MPSTISPLWVSAGAISICAVSLFAYLSTGDHDSRSNTISKKRSHKESPSEQSNETVQQEEPVAQVGGMRNIGNTCFLNSILQSFAACDSFRHFLFALRDEIPQEPFISLFVDVVQGRLWDPTDFHMLIRAEAEQFRNSQQQDAHELYNSCMEILEAKISLVERLPNMVRNPAAWNAISLKDPCHGLLGSILVCRSCGNGRPIKHSTFTSLSLSFISSTTPQSLDQMLAAYVRAEAVSGVVCDLCSGMKRRAKLRQFRGDILEKAKGRPAIGKRTKAVLLQSSHETRDTESKIRTLIMEGGSVRYAHMLSSEHDETLFSLDQNTVDTSTGIKDPLFLLAPPPVPAALKAPKTVRSDDTVKTDKIKGLVIGRLPRMLVFHLNRLMGDMKIQAFVQFPLQLDMGRYCGPGMYNDGLKVQSSGRGDSSVPYVLQSVVVHHGGASSGHFTAFRRRYNDTEARWVWVHISDEVVREVAERDVLTSMAYMLFYERV